MSSKVIGSGSQILSLTVNSLDHKTFRVAFGTYNQCIHVFTINDDFVLESIFSVQMKTSRPASIAFSNDGKSGRGDVIVFGRDDGIMCVPVASFNTLTVSRQVCRYTLDGRNGRIINTATMNPPAW